MHLDRQFAEVHPPAFIPGRWAVVPIGVFGTCSAEQQRWVEIYRMARERTEQALRPTRYDRALRASVN